MNTSSDVDSYLEQAPEVQRMLLQEVRTLIQSIAPDAVESISYGIPAYKHRGKPLVYFGSAKNHWALYALSTEGFEERLAGYKQAKGTIRFPLDQPVPTSLVRELVEARLAKIDEDAAQAGKP